MNIIELSAKLGVSFYGIKHFMEDFELEVSECLEPNLTVKENFFRFLKENKSFITKYEKDLFKEKTIQQIAKKINKSISDVECFLKENNPNVLENGIFKTSVSSYQVDYKLGGDYTFIYNYFGEKIPLAQMDFVGYRDLYFHLIEMLNPFIDEEQAKNWGIHKSAGIMLYGPKGSGKIFWAHKIADIINYRFKEIQNLHNLKSGIFSKTLESNAFFTKQFEENDLLLFYDNFQNIASSFQQNGDYRTEELKSNILNNIQNFVKENLLMVVSVDELSNIDPEITAPGRFDIKIPIFPPNENERSEMIVRQLTCQLSEDAILMKILKYNKAHFKTFWTEYASKMKLFSNTMVIDFTQSIKRKLRNQYLKLKTHEIIIDKNTLDSSLLEAVSKLTEEYFNSIQQFLYEVTANHYDVFSNRIEQMKQEFEAYKIDEQPIREIGFNKNERV